MAVLVGCTPSRKEWRHPMPEFQPSETEVGHRLDLDHNALNILPFFFDTASITGTIPINTRTQVEDEFYEQPAQVDIDQNGYIYVAHQRANTIHVFNPEGEPKYKIGRSGRGAGDIMDLHTFVLDNEAERLYVLDAFEIDVYERMENRFKYIRSIALKFQQVFDMCKLGTYLYVSGINMDKKFLKEVNTSGVPKDRNDGSNTNYYISNPITRISLAGMKPDTTFGYLYHSVVRNPVVTGILSETLLDCNEQTNTLLGYQKHFSFIFGYDPEGNQKWLSKLDNYLSMEHIENPGHYPHANEGLYQRKFRPRTLSGSRYSLLQMAYVKPQKYFGDPDNTPIPKYNLRSILVDTETGELFNSDVYDLMMYKDSTTAITIDYNFPNYEFRLFKHTLR